MRATVCEEVEAVERQAMDHETRISSLDSLHKVNKMLKFKLNNLEGRNNIRIVGIPEGAEKGR